MKVQWIVKINFLVLGLGLCAFAMWKLNTAGLPGGIFGILQIETAQTPAPVAEESKVRSLEKLATMNWCKKPIRQVTAFKNHPNHPNRFSQKTTGSESLKTWLDNNCSLIISELEADTDIKSFLPRMTFVFSGGGQLTLFTGDDGLYRMGKKAFRSQQLDAALANIDQLFE